MWFKSLTLGALLILVGLSAPALAQKTNKVIAKVNGVAVTLADVELFKKEQRSFLQNIPQDRRYKFIVSLLIQEALMSKAALDAKLHEGANYKFRISYFTKKALSETFQQERIIPKITDARVKAHYDNLVANAKPVDEVRARHILLKNKEDAEAVIADLKKGADFSELARARSIGASAKLGGDLGYFTEKQYEAALSKAAFKLKKGEISAPIQTKFGWHVLKLEDRRKRKLQAYKDIKNQLRNILLKNEINDTIRGMLKSAKIEYLDPKAKPVKAK